MGIIYSAVNCITGKRYIGKTISTLKKRKRDHKLNALTRNTTGMLYDSIRKYGWDVFEWSILEDVDVNELDSREVFYIDKFDTFRTGYNMTPGGTGGVTYRTGTKLYEQLIDDGKLGRWKDGTSYSEKNPGATPPAIEKRRTTFSMKDDSEWLRGEDHPNYGKSKPDGFSDKLSGANNPQYGKHPAPKPVVIDGVYYESRGKAASVIGVSRRTITNRVKNDKFPNYTDG